MRELDLLRFLAALGVLLFHFSGFGGTSGPWPDPAREVFPALGAVTRYGYLGVDLFFVISGFVILMSAWGRGPGEFAVSRVVRLMPAYWAAVLLGAAIYVVFGLGAGRPGVVLPNLTMLQGGLGVRNVDAVFWTLWVELHFYLLMAVLLGIGLTYRRCVMFMTIWLFLGLFAEEADSKLLKIMVMPTWHSYFIGGMALYLIYRFGSSLPLWGFVAVSWLMAIRWSVWRAGPIFDGVSDGVVAVAVTGIFAMLALVATHRLGWLRWRGLTVLGALTYPLYLTHSQLALPLLHAIYPGVDRWMALALATACSLLLAYGIHRLVERPVAVWLRPRLREALARVRAIDAASRRATATATGASTPSASSVAAVSHAKPAAPSAVLAQRPADELTGSAPGT